MSVPPAAPPPAAGGTHALLKSFLPQKSHISSTLVDITDLAAVEAAMQPNTKVGGRRGC